MRTFGITLNPKTPLLLAMLCLSQFPPSQGVVSFTVPAYILQSGSYFNDGRMQRFLLSNPKDIVMAATPWRPDELKAALMPDSDNAQAG